MNACAALADYKFLIVAGTSKAGTTSLFNYLANHPQICPSRAKETRFFLDLDYPLSSELRYDRDGPSAYLSFYDSGREDDWRLEATPDYLYSKNSARLIRETLSNVKLIFILREPGARLVAMYRFGQKMGEIPKAMNFDQFVEVQARGDVSDFINQHRHPAYYALQHGRYSLYLRPFLESFSRHSIYVAFQEDLSRDPFVVIRDVARFAGIDDHFCESNSFKRMNKGVKVRSTFVHGKYWRTKEMLRDSVQHSPKVRQLLRQIGNWVDGAYRILNMTDYEEVAMSRATEAFVSAYYKEEPARLREMLGIDVPWPEYCCSDAKVPAELRNACDGS
jgi:Sulfotransferase domain